MLRLLLAHQGEALLEDLDPSCRRVCSKLVVDGPQDAILLSDNLLNCPPSMQRWCAVGLAPGEESGDCRQQFSLWAGGLLEDREIDPDLDTALIST